MASRRDPAVEPYRRAHALMDLGRVRLLAGDAAEAEPLFAEAVRVRRAAAIPDFAESLAYQSAALRRLGRAAEAEPLRREAEQLLARTGKLDWAERGRDVLAGRMPRWP
jgi:hypothetical protein